MHKLRFLLTVYARPFYRGLGWAAAASAIVAAAAFFTPWFMPVAIVIAAAVAALAGAAATMAILVLNAAVAAHLHRDIERFEAAYNVWRKANNVFDIFYEEMDLEDEAIAKAERERAAGAA
jgi:hypothetical protein